jgi:predicted outer membrane protein
MLMMRHSSKLYRQTIGAFVALAIAGVAACSEKQYATPTPAAGGPNDRPTAEAVRSDADIAAVTSALNAGEIEHAEIARTRARAPDVQGFAAHMITDHSDAQRRQTALFESLGILPQENAVSHALTAEAGTVTASLRDEDAGAFDVAYMDS